MVHGASTVHGVGAAQLGLNVGLCCGPCLSRFGVFLFWGHMQGVQLCVPIMVP
jgi:hypothetical protein